MTSPMPAPMGRQSRETKFLKEFRKDQMSWENSRT
jgi:hypothetical protein